jgi:hypothetical protein
LLALRTIYDFVNLCCEKNSLEIIVYDLSKEVNVYEGEYRNIPFMYKNMEILSWELTTRNDEQCICFNIDTSI